MTSLPLRQHSRQWPMLPLLLALAGVGAAFLLYPDYLHRAYFEDDFGFLSGGPLRLADLPHVFSPIEIGWFYRPVFVVYTKAMISLFGGAGIPRHAVSLILFGFTGAALGGLAGRLSGRVAAGWLALLLFMTAGGMGEAVWWFSSASTLLATLFAFLAVHAWMNWGEGRGKGWAWAAGGCVAMALCSKEDAVSLPLMLAAFDLCLAPRDALRARLARLAPLALGTCVWAALDVTAYRHVSSLEPITRLWRPDMAYKLLLTASFAYRTLFQSLVGSGPVLAGPVWVMALGMAGLVAWRVRRHPILTACLACAILAALPMPLLTGGHVLSERFAFYPQAWACLFGAVLLMQALHSPCRVTRAAGWAVASQCLYARLPLPAIDPIWTLGMTALAGLLLGYAAIRTPSVRPLFAIASAALLGAFAASLFLIDYAALWWELVFVVCAAFARRFAALDGGLCGVALMVCAPWTLPLTLAGPLLAGKRLSQTYANRH